MKKKLILGCILSLLVLPLFAQGSKESNTTGTREKVMKFPTYLAGENVGAKFFGPQVERFNAKYAGKYKLVVEEVPQATYADKIKQLTQQKKAPALIHSPGSGGIDLQWFWNVAYKNGLCYDLSGFLADNPDIDNLVLDGSRDFVTRDGQVVAMPIIAIRPVGLYYNEALYKPSKPIRDMSMDEFFDSLGSNKIAFQTADNAWTSGLLLSILIAHEDGGLKWLQDNFETKAYDFNVPAFVNGIAKLQKLFQTKAAANSVGAAYADAANAFMSNEAAVICNGSWMASEFADSSSGKWSNGFDGKNVHTDIYPGHYSICNDRSFGDFWVSTTASDDEREVALAFLKFRYSQPEIEAYLLAEGGTAPKMKTSQEYKDSLAKEAPLLKELDDASATGSTYVPNVLEVMPNSISDTEFGKLLPKLVDGSVSAEEFCNILTEKAQDIKADL